MPLISVSEYVKKKLDQIRKEEQHTSYDSVIRTLILEREYNKKGGRLRETLKAPKSLVASAAAETTKRRQNKHYDSNRSGNDYSD